MTKTVHSDYYSEFTEHTDPLFSELKLLKFKDIFSLTNGTSMFNFINENVPEELKKSLRHKQIFTSYETGSSLVFHTPKAKKSHFRSNTLRYDGGNLWNKSYHAFLYKESNLTKANLK